MEIRARVLMEPRGFIRVLEWLLAIIAFATTGGFSTKGTGSVSCPIAAGDSSSTENMTFQVVPSYPFNLESDIVKVPNCTKTAEGKWKYGTDIETYLEGDFSPTSQWFVFVGVMAFLLCMASVVFYVAFEAEYRQQHERAVTITDFAVTCVFAFLWLTAAASWAWGIGQVKYYGTPDRILSDDTVNKMCKQDEEVSCRTLTYPDYSPLNASVAFAFLSFFVWVSNIWFVYKETPYHDDGKMGSSGGAPNQQVPSNQM